ncbi:hypothetical protein [Cystobacter fuscus]|uniref:hypothetical protein n=1 Tax=Cystobacter fuscus TaxID=43 RepID=UPI0037C047B3
MRIRHLRVWELAKLTEALVPTLKAPKPAVEAPQPVVEAPQPSPTGVKVQLARVFS